MHRLRELDLKKHPSVSETLDWARALMALNAPALDKDVLDNTLTVLLKHEADVLRARRVLGQGADDDEGKGADDLNVRRLRRGFR